MKLFFNIEQNINLAETNKHKIEKKNVVEKQLGKQLGKIISENSIIIIIKYHRGNIIMEKH